MKSYKTSKDYKRLKELLDKGYEVLVAYPDNSVHVAWKHSVGVYYFGNGNGYDTRLSAQERCSFERKCECIEIEFIEPNEEEQ